MIMVYSAPQSVQPDYHSADGNVEAAQAWPDRIGTAARHGDVIDDLVIDQVYRALFASGYGQLRRLRVSCRDQCVKLEGHLPTYYLKQVAQSVAGPVLQGCRIENAIQVVS